MEKNEELERELKRVVPQKIQEAVKAQKRRHKGKSAVQQFLEDLDTKDRRLRQSIQRMQRMKRMKQRKGFEPNIQDLEYRFNPQLREIERKMRDRLPSETVLHCPKCKERDQGNRMNNQPYCFKCQVPLESKEQTKKRRPTVKVLSKKDALNEQHRTLMPGVYPNNEETEDE